MKFKAGYMHGGGTGIEVRASLFPVIFSAFYFICIDIGESYD